jgi:hypothetical protein
VGCETSGGAFGASLAFLDVWTRGGDDVIPPKLSGGPSVLWNVARPNAGVCAQVVIFGGGRPARAD